MGEMFDGTGTYPIANAVASADSLTFTVVHHSPGVGEVPVNYTVNLDSNDLKVLVERPDPTPEGKAKGLKRKSEAAVVRSKD